jgi:hypothetical protein
MRIYKIVSFFVVILLIIALFSGISAVFPAALPAAAQSTNTLSYQSSAGPFIGSKDSDVYHYPTCYHVQAIKPENRVTFATVQDACAHNYRPCKDCNPPPCTAPTPTPKPTPTPTTTPKPTSPIATPKPTPSTPTVSQARASVTPTSSPAAATAIVAQASATASSSTSTPGLEGLYAVGAIAIVALALWFNRRK